MTDDTKKAEKTKAGNTDFENHIEVLDSGKAKAPDRHRSATEATRLYTQLQEAHHAQAAALQAQAEELQEARGAKNKAVSELAKAQTRIEELIGQPAKLQGKLDRASTLIAEQKKTIGRLEGIVGKLDAEFPEAGLKKVAQSLSDDHPFSTKSFFENADNQADASAKARAAKNDRHGSSWRFHKLATKLGVPRTITSPWLAELEEKHGQDGITDDYYKGLEVRLLPASANIIMAALDKFDTDSMWTTGNGILQ